MELLEQWVKDTNELILDSKERHKTPVETQHTKVMGLNRLSSDINQILPHEIPPLG
ncbi:hypothetical protein [Shewanella sp. UCD-KL12]|uniref:hypothetical protein n=1 Tax=Shewanella sp. UCD-KL12 TaxID=1917163 RepID=UPI0015C4032A|nr:hypothetical protein [Shewanella sp. UCD-KL12]